MQPRISQSKLMRNEEGAMAVVIVLIMVVLLGMASLAIDVGQIYAVRNELQNTADTAALAAVNALIVEDPVSRATYRDAKAAVNAAMSVIQTTATDKGLAWDPNGYDISINFGTWVDHGSVWTLIGDKSLVSSTSNANAVQITIKRASGKTYGPVTNCFAAILGSNTTEVAATARAYMGYIYSVYAGTVEVPLALPTTILQMASKGKPGWFARAFAPYDAEAASKKTYVFKDTGGNNTDNGLNSAPLDPSQPYFFIVGKNDPVPNTIWDILDRISNPNFLNGTDKIYYVANLKLSDQVYAVSEFKYPSYIVEIFKRLQKAYDAKKDSNGLWRVTLPVYSGTPNPLKTSRHLGDGFMALARLLLPWPSAAQACYVLANPPNMYVNGFVNVDITNVSVNAACNQCNNWQAQGYKNKKDCLLKDPSSCWNSNSVTIENVTDVSTVIPGIPNVAGEAGGLSAKEMNSAAPGGVGAFANIPKLLPLN
jgi:Flp pilus assembly protein TadG